MANSRCVGLQCNVKDIYDKSHKKPVLEQMRETIQSMVDKKKGKGLVFENKCNKDGWLLKATVVSLTVDNPSKPTKLEVKASIDGVPLFGTANGFKAKGGSKASGINAKKVDKEIRYLVDGILQHLMNKQVLPHLLKSA